MPQNVWEKTFEILQERPHRFYDAFNWLSEHPIFSPDGHNGGFQSCYVIDVVKVNPETDKIDDDDSKNSAVRIWIECGPWENEAEYWKDVPEEYRKPGGGPTLDLELDCGAPTFEEAIIELAKLVRENYGDYTIED